ncbi:MAG TPA: hypothetical protein VLT33_36035 [Labilithrix sp.]|nr:hypothetical protein [Labilithrix sp.]
MSTKAGILEEQRSRLERRANVLRSRLLRTVEVLDKRRHQVTELGHQAKRLALPLGGALLGAIVVAAGTTLAVRAFLENRREQRFGYRLSKSLAPLRREERPPFWQEAARKIAMTAIGMIATQLMKRGVVFVTAERLTLTRTTTSPPLALPPAP